MQFAGTEAKAGDLKQLLSHLVADYANVQCHTYTATTLKCQQVSPKKTI